MIKRQFYGAILFFLSHTLHAQTNFNVIAVDGLFMRTQPSLEGRKIYQFMFGEELMSIDSISIDMNQYTFTLSDTNSWIEVVNHEGLKGYVYGYYLSPKFYRPNPPYYDDEFGSRNTTIYINGAKVVIPNYQSDGKRKSGDTVYVWEAVFNEIGDKIVYVEPTDSLANISVEYTCVEELNPWGAADSNGNKVPRWKHHEPFQHLNPIHNNFFPTPVTAYDSIRENSAKRLHLERSPDWDHVGEGWWVPRYIFHGAIVPYQITSVLIKITLEYPNGEKVVTVLSIGLSYGC